MAKRYVWLCWQNFAPDSIPKRPRVEHVFATEEPARAWRMETIEHERSFGNYRSVECREVERAAPPSSRLSTKEDTDAR